jgi:hypothetical protein
MILFICRSFVWRVVAVKKNEVWYGYLDAGEKSSPVVLDPTLNTANPKTVYLFNLTRGEILEYRREIVEPKLRELTPEEGDGLDELKQGYAQARRGFTARGGRVLNLPERRAAAPKAQKPVDDAEVDFDDDSVDEEDWEGEIEEG